MARSNYHPDRPVSQYSYCLSSIYEVIFEQPRVWNDTCKRSTASGLNGYPYIQSLPPKQIK